MNFRRVVRWKMLLLSMIPVAIFVALGVAVRERQTQPRVAIIGKWRLIVEYPAYVQYRAVEFLADGRYTEKAKTLQPISAFDQGWTPVEIQGHYTISTNSEFRVSTNTYQYGTVAYLSKIKPVKIIVHGYWATVNVDQQVEHWYRIKQ